MLKYKRILLKLSGEALAGNKEFGFSNEVLESFAKQIKEVHEKGVEVAIVIGGGTYAKHFNRVLAFGALFPWEEDRMHMTDERISLDSYSRMANIFAATVYNLCCR